MYINEATNEMVIKELSRHVSDISTLNRGLYLLGRAEGWFQTALVIDQFENIPYVVAR